LKKAESSACGETRSSGRRPRPAKCITAGAEPRYSRRGAA
jgi:hypothetical protein